MQPGQLGIDVVALRVMGADVTGAAATLREAMRAAGSGTAPATQPGTAAGLAARAADKAWSAALDRLTARVERLGRKMTDAADSYQVTDQGWTADVPGGPGWTAEVMRHGVDYGKSGLDDFGIVLERATIDHPGPAARHLVEAIVYESSIGEKVTAAAATGAAAHETKQESTEFMKTDVIRPEIRDSMARIMSGYIADVNGNIADADYGTPESIDVDRQQLVRFLADIGKDEAAHDIVARAEAAYGATANDHVLSGRQNPDADLRANLDAMKVISQNYGEVMGALDVGATEAKIETSAQLDETFRGRPTSTRSSQGWGPRAPAIR